MKHVTINVTAEDLLGDAWDMFDCPGLRAIKRVIPSLESWLFSYGFTTNRRLDIPYEASVNFIQHARYQSRIPFGIKAEPFSFTMTVPDEVETIES